MKPPSSSRELPATAVLECNSVAGRWRLETGGALDEMQDVLVAFGAVGLPVLLLTMFLPDPARNWAAAGFAALVAIGVMRLFQRSRRGAQVLIEADHSQVMLGALSWPKATVHGVQAWTWMRKGVPGFKVDLVVLDEASPVLVMKGTGHPLPEGVLRRFCLGSNLAFEVADKDS